MNLVPVTENFHGGTIVEGLKVGERDRVLCKLIAFSDQGMAHLTEVKYCEIYECQKKREPQINWERNSASEYFNVVKGGRHRKATCSYANELDGLTVTKQEITRLYSFKENGEKMRVTLQDYAKKTAWIFRTREEAIKLAEKETDENNKETREYNSTCLPNLKDNYRDHCARVAYNKRVWIARLFSREEKWVDKFIEANKADMDEEVIKLIPEEINFE